MRSIDMAVMLDVLARQDVLLGVFSAGAGLVFMMLGFRLSRPLVAISFGILGFVLGSLVPAAEPIRLAFGLIGAVGLGAASTYYVRMSVTVLGGAWAGYLAMLTAGYCEMPAGIQLAIGAVVFGVGVSLAAIARREMTAFVLSFEGSLLVLACAGGVPQPESLVVVAHARHAGGLPDRRAVCLAGRYRHRVLLADVRIATTRDGNGGIDGRRAPALR